MALILLTGALLGHSLLSSLLASQEDRHFQALAAATNPSDGRSPEDAEALVAGIHTIYAPRASTCLTDLPPQGWREALVSSIGDRLTTGCGGCGAYAGVLARTAQMAGWDVRLVQILNDRDECVHVVTELHTTEGWMFADAMFRVTGRSNDVHATLDTKGVAGQWTLHPETAPEIYRVNSWIPHRFRYTNWSAVPLGSAVRWVLEALRGETWVEGLSLRSHVLNMHRVRAVVTATLATMLLLVLLLTAWRRRRRGALTA